MLMVFKGSLFCLEKQGRENNLSDSVHLPGDRGVLPGTLTTHFIWEEFAGLLPYLLCRSPGQEAGGHGGFPPGKLVQSPPSQRGWITTSSQRPQIQVIMHWPVWKNI